MIAAKLIELIEIHASRLAAEVAGDLMRNERTPSFRAVPREDLEERVYQIFNHLGDWISNRRADEVRAEFSEWGRRRFGQGIPLSEIIYSVIVMKQHLRRYIRDNGLVEAAFPRTDADMVMPMHMLSLQDLNAQVGQFFDEALYYLASGFEAGARNVSPAR